MSLDPSDELIDLLDDAGQVIGVVRRGQMRRERLPHSCVYLVVFNSRGDLFVHQRTASKDVFPSYWDLTVGGVPAAGESFDQAALREGREEIGVDLRPVPLFPFRYDGEHAIAHAIVYHATHDGPFRLQPEEISRGEFVALADLPELIARERFCPDGLQVWDEFRRFQKSLEKS
jgi:isopentenyldiphosphate isomerase